MGTQERHIKRQGRSHKRNQCRRRGLLPLQGIAQVDQEGLGRLGGEKRGGQQGHIPFKQSMIRITDRLTEGPSKGTSTPWVPLLRKNSDKV
ncbi:hypothetical protein NPIL_275081 [Nephila pilipes]|uniref:Uncharacterized protein n=1 Tax=Nephila pilipes TaxID=299642 RepID=A0A8X6NMH8_NEPPI|nr:hypothetical protein NPIL_275081 [Nephila pilipes]